jgi:hypothetical protein
MDQKENVFAERYARWIKAELSFRNPRRNVARDQVTAIWGMWKSRRFQAETGKASRKVNARVRDTAPPKDDRKKKERARPEISC